MKKVEYKNKNTAAILAILLGCIWLHKFYLWKWFQWIIYICIVMSWVSTILWIIEGILYLINDQERFNLNVNFKHSQKVDYINNKN